MNETSPRKGSALDNALWPLKYANKNPERILDQPRVTVEGAAKLLREFDEAFPAIGAMALQERSRYTHPQLDQIPRSK